jgi:hypothetical protein
MGALERADGESAQAAEISAVVPGGIA